MKLNELPLNLARRAMFTPCKTKEELDRWIRMFLAIRLPDKVVSEESNSSPLDMIWSLYDRAVRNDTEGWKRSMTYASRFGGKTLGASILETLIVLHTKRNIAHMAAIRDQSRKAQEYVKGFFSLPFLQDFVVGDNDTEVVIVTFTNTKTGDILTMNEHAKLAPAQQNEFVRKENYIRIIACTMQSANGQHVEFFVVDEVDVIEKKNLRAYDQAKGGVPTSRGGMEAMTLFTSTRKSRIGKVQQEIDRAPKTGLRLNHWNIIDITEPCGTERHKPELPKETYWINDADVTHITDAEYNALAESEKHKWYAREGYAGCRGCRLFAACKGALATEQTGKIGDFAEGGTALLMPISEIIDKFKDASPEFITTEYLCRKPDTSGLVYPRYNRDIHRKTSAEIAEMVSGEPHPEIDTKEKLIKFLAEMGATFATGMDFGYNHLFAVVTAAIWGNIAYVVDVVGMAKQELDDKMLLTEHLKKWNASIWADPEDPASIMSFKRRGWRMKEWSKNAGSVKGGIDIVRNKLYSKASGPTVFFLADDPMMETLLTHVRDYHFMTGPDGQFTEVPDEVNDDLPDALRYLLMNVFGKDGGLKNPNLGLAPVQKADLEHWSVKAERQNQAALRNIIGGLTGKPNVINFKEAAESKPTRRGGFWADI